MNQENYWHGRSPSNDLSYCHGQLGQADHGMHPLGIECFARSQV
jgi:hypothetical protein